MRDVIVFIRIVKYRLLISLNGW